MIGFNLKFQNQYGAGTIDFGIAGWPWGVHRNQRGLLMFLDLLQLELLKTSHPPNDQQCQKNFALQWRPEQQQHSGVLARDTCRPSEEGVTPYLRAREGENMPLCLKHIKENFLNLICFHWETGMHRYRKCSQVGSHIWVLVFAVALLKADLQATLNLRLPNFWVLDSVTLILLNHMGFSIILNDFLKGLDSILLIASVFSGQLRSLLQFGVSLGRCPEQTKEELWGFSFSFFFFSPINFTNFRFMFVECIHFFFLSY